MSFTPLHFMTAEGSGSIVFAFLTLQGSLLPVQKEFDREQRAGVNGIGLWLTGSRGKPFQIQTTLDCVDVATAQSVFGNYVDAVGTKKDLYYANGLFKTVLVHEVQLQSIRKLQAAVGGVQGFSGGSGALLSASWTIEALYS